MSDQSWYYLSGQQAIGPLSPEQMRAAVERGQVRAQTKVRLGASGSWFLASQVPGLLRAPPLQTPEAAPPRRPGPPVVAPLRAGPPPVVAGPPVAVQNAPDAPPGGETGQVEPASADDIEEYAIPGGLGPRPWERKRQGRFGALRVVYSGFGLGISLAVVAALVWQFFLAPPATTDAPAPRASAETPPRGAASAAKDKPAPAEATQLARNEPALPDLASALVTTRMASGGSFYPPVPEVFQTSADPTPANRIDELVFARLKQLGIQPAKVCSDAVFLRRAFIDVIGTLPTADEVRRFLADTDPNKRQALVEHLLQREEYADYWAMKWSDILRVKAEFPINLWPNAAQAYHRWIRTCIKRNMPYDRFVREMLTACGSNFREPQVNFYRALQSKKPVPIAKTVALTFMGSRAENWPPGRLEGMAVFFSRIGYKSTGEWKEEIVYFDPGKPAAPVASDPAPKDAAPGKAPPAAAAPSAANPTATFPDGTTVALPPDRDPREVFADWLIDGKNPWFTRPIVNRVWYWLVGRGIVHEPDDFRPDNPPENPELLDYLAQELVRARYDLKHVYRLILNSKTYQLASIPTTTDPKGAANFAYYPLRRLEAEVLIDALCQITGSTESYSSMIPEPFTWIPEDRRAIALPDGSITSSFLEMFGRPPRDTGMESERSQRLTPAQRLHLLNSSHVRRMFEQGPTFQGLVSAKSGRPQELTEELFLTILSRPPTDDEHAVVASQPPMDQAWLLINTDEFLFRH